MVPQNQKKKPGNSSRVNLLVSLFFHAAVAIVVIYFAAREGLLGKQFKKIAVEMVKEKPPEKPREPEKPKEPLPTPVTPKTIAKVETPREPAAAPPPVTVAAAPAAVAPAAVDVPSFSFAGGKSVETSSDPAQLYKGLLQSALQSRWDRPEDMEDDAYVAEVEVAVDRTGKISEPVWKKSSGNQRWDNSVKRALLATTSVNRPPPSNFPPRVIVRFDVVAAEAFPQ